VTATSNGLTLTTTESAMLSRPLKFQGWAPRSQAGSNVMIERRPAGSTGGWIPTASATIAPSGSFAATWRTSQSGRLTVRARVATQATQTAAPTATVATPTATVAAPTATVAAPTATAASAATANLTVTVLRAQLASWYGPGLFGRRTACGERLTPNTVGVASLTLRCGTLVDLVYRGRSLTVPVIDRGPYARGVRWDLTEATAFALGLTQTDTIGALAVGKQ
jgi:hypothetical protein